MGLENFLPPSKGQLEAIEAELRLTFARLGKTPKRVREASDENEVNQQWHNEAVRYYYLCVRRGIDPMHTDPNIYRMIANEWDKEQGDDDGPELIRSVS